MRILLVEDDSLLGDGLCAGLRQMAFQVDWVRDGIAAEHAHSCCILIASTRFRVNGKWHTRIGYEKFFKCLESGKPFTPEDYMGDETPEWATWGQGGFDPRDERVYRKGKNKQPLPEGMGKVVELDD